VPSQSTYFISGTRCSKGVAQHKAPATFFSHDTIHSQCKNDKKKWGISKNKEPAPFVKQILLLHICPPDMLEKFRHCITYIL
jgi:hypothetical protein